MSICDVGVFFRRVVSAVSDFEGVVTNDSKTQSDELFQALNAVVPDMLSWLAWARSHGESQLRGIFSSGDRKVAIERVKANLGRQRESLDEIEDSLVMLEIDQSPYAQYRRRYATTRNLGHKAAVFIRLKAAIVYLKMMSKLLTDRDAAPNVDYSFIVNTKTRFVWTTTKTACRALTTLSVHDDDFKEMYRRLHNWFKDEAEARGLLPLDTFFVVGGRRTQYDANIVYECMAGVLYELRKSDRPPTIFALMLISTDDLINTRIEHATEVEPVGEMRKLQTQIEFLLRSPQLLTLGDAELGSGY